MIASHIAINRLRLRSVSERDESTDLSQTLIAQVKAMLTTKRKPAGVGEILNEEFMEPLGLTQSALAEAMGVQRRYVNELCTNRRSMTASTALILARVFGNSPDYWLNVQRRIDLWEAINSPEEQTRIKRAKPIGNN